MKLLAGLAVVITMASAMTFVGLATRPAPVEESVKADSMPSDPQKTYPDPNTTTGSAAVDTQVNIIDNTVKSKVTVQ